MMDLVILEFADEVDAFLIWRRKQAIKNSKINVIALEPETQVKLRQAGIKYYNSVDFFGLKGHKSALNTSDRFTRILRENISIKDDFNLSEGYNNTMVFYTRIFFHHLLFLTEVISQAVEKLNPKRLIFPQGQIPKRRSKLINRNERFLGYICESFCKANKLEYDIIHSNSVNRFTDWFFYLYETYVKVYIQQIVFILLIRIYKYKSNKIILAPSENYNMSLLMNKFHVAYKNTQLVYLTSKNKKDLLFQVLKKKSPFLFLLSSRVSQKRRINFVLLLNKNIKKLQQAVNGNRLNYCYKGVSFSAMLFSFIEQVMFPVLISQYGKTICLSKILVCARPSLVLSQFALDEVYNLGELCKQLGIPSLLISHGSHTPPHDETAAIEWKEHGKGLMNTRYPYLAVQTPWAQKYLEKIPSPHSKVLITGPILFARNNNQVRDKIEFRKKTLPHFNDKTVILHASSPRIRGRLRFWVYETVDEYIENINALIRVVEKLENSYLVVRFRPSEGLSVGDLKELLIDSDCYDIYTDGSFSDFLLSSDILISYSSTTIEEALQNSIPVLLYDSHGKYCHIPSPVLCKNEKLSIESCYYINNEEDLYWGLSWLKDHHMFSDDNNIWWKHKFDLSKTCDIINYFQPYFK